MFLEHGFADGSYILQHSSRRLLVKRYRLLELRRSNNRVDLEQRHDLEQVRVCLGHQRIDTTRGSLTTLRPPICARPKKASAPNSGSYRTSAFSWCLSNLVLNSCSICSPISCQVLPAAFIFFRTVSAWLRSGLYPLMIALIIPEGSPQVLSQNTPDGLLGYASFKGPTAPLLRLGLSQ